MTSVYTNPTSLRKSLAKFLKIATFNIVVIKGKDSNKILIDEKEYNRLSSLADQFEIEDPEGNYRLDFEQEMLSRSVDNKVEASVKSLQDLL